VITTPEEGLETSEPLEATPPRHAKAPSVRPALVVLACAAVVTFGGFALAVVGGSKPATVGGLGRAVPGVNLTAIGAAGVLHRLVSGGTPPKDVLDALVVPKGAQIVSTTDSDAGIDQYDRSVYLKVDTTSKELVRFYQAELKWAHWYLLGEYRLPGSAKELLARRAGSDGYEWEVGVIVTPVNPAISPSLAGDTQPSSTMGLRLRLFQIPDGGS